MKNTEKVIVSIQLPKEIHENLKKQAEAECTSVSYLIRRLLIMNANNYKEEDNNER